MPVPKYYPAPQLPANIEYQDAFDAITDVVDTNLLTTLAGNVDNLMNTLCTPDGILIEPERPASVNNEAAWDTYRTAVQTYYNTLNDTREDIETQMTAINVGLQDIIELLPPNIWIKFSVDTVTTGWPTSSGSPVPPKYFGWHTNDADPGYVPALLKLQSSYDPAEFPLTDDDTNPLHVDVLNLDGMFQLINHFDRAAFLRVLAGNYTGV